MLITIQILCMMNAELQYRCETLGRRAVPLIALTLLYTDDMQYEYQSGLNINAWQLMSLILSD